MTIYREYEYRVDVQGYEDIEVAMYTEQTYQHNMQQFQLFYGVTVRVRKSVNLNTLIGP